MTIRNLAGEALTAGVARRTGARSKCHDADVWILPWYTVTLRGVRWHHNIRLCEECGEDR